MSRFLVRYGVCGLMACLPMLPIRAQQYVAESSRSARDAEVLSRPISVDLKDVPVKFAVVELTQRAGVRVQFQSEVLDAVRTPVTLRAKRTTLGDALERVLMGTHLRAVALPPDAILIEHGETRGNTEVAEPGIIAGRVVDSRGNKPVSSATVTLNESKSVRTNEEGAFRFAGLAPGEYTIVVRAVGFGRQVRRVTVESDKTASVEFSMQASSSVLDEVVVTGTVVATERKAIATPITIITAEDIERRNITRIEQLFRGEVPGVIALETGSQAVSGASSTGGDSLGTAVTSSLYSRGSSGLGLGFDKGTSSPLKTYVDGVELVNAAYLGTIDPKSIERIEIITGPQAATIYGSGAMGGVMQIFTKKGSGHTTPDMTLSLRYGAMQSSVSDGKTPTHSDNLSVLGGTGPEFSYSGSLSYNYSGQWQPGLYVRQFGAAGGVTHARGPVTISGSVSTTGGSNGTAYGSSGYFLRKVLAETGEYSQVNLADWTSKRVSTSSSQMLSLNVDYRPFTVWQHHMTVGKSLTHFGLIPEAPRFSQPSDTLFKTTASDGRRTTLAYNTSLVNRLGVVSSSMTVGANGSFGETIQFTGCTPAKSTTSYVACDAFTAPVTKPLDDRSWGGFASWQIGFFDHAYVTLGLRGERNPNYGSDHAIDWTPTQGATYTVELGELSVKFLASYGRATRAPSPEQRLPRISSYAGYDPAVIVERLANPELTPEYSSGPQGGIELYYGNLGSLTINRHRQTIRSLIQSVNSVDSLLVTDLASGTSFYWTQFQWQNTATVRQQGWEGTASLNLGPLAFKGTYSWDDSRVLWFNPKSALAFQYTIGQGFKNVPTHTGSVITSYAHGKTSLVLTTNFIGSSLQSLNTGILWANNSYRRIGMYNDCKVCTTGSVSRPIRQDGYMRANFSASHRVTPWASVTIDVTNLGNSYASDVGPLYPTLGRQTVFGVTLRSPFDR